jgi:hypothetical protein
VLFYAAAPNLAAALIQAGEERLLRELAWPEVFRLWPYHSLSRVDEQCKSHLVTLLT